MDQLVENIPNSPIIYQELSNERSSRTKAKQIAVPSTVSAGRRPKAPSRAPLRSQDDIERIKKALTEENTENQSVVAKPPAVNIKLSKSLLEFDTEIEYRCKQMETEGQLASVALNQVLAIWKMQLPPMLKKLPIAEFNNTYKGNISAALTSATENKVTPLMTPSVVQSTRKPASHRSALKTPQTASKSIQTTSSSHDNEHMDVDKESHAIQQVSDFNPAKLDLLSTSVLSQVMSQNGITDDQKLEVLSALKRQISVIEKSLPAVRKNKK